MFATPMATWKTRRPVLCQTVTPGNKRAWRINAPANETFELSYQDKLFHYQSNFPGGKSSRGLCRLQA